MRVSVPLCGICVCIRRLRVIYSMLLPLVMFLNFPYKFESFCCCSFVLYPFWWQRFSFILFCFLKLPALSCSHWAFESCSHNCWCFVLNFFSFLSCFLFCCITFRYSSSSFFLCYFFILNYEFCCWCCCCCCCCCCFVYQIHNFKTEEKFVQLLRPLFSLKSLSGWFSCLIIFTLRYDSSISNEKKSLSSTSSSSNTHKYPTNHLNLMRICILFLYCIIVVVVVVVVVAIAVVKYCIRYLYIFVKFFK